MSRHQHPGTHGTEIAQTACGSVSDRAKGESTRKSVQFSDAEVYELLQIIRAWKPIGMDMWKDVEADWNTLAATCVGFSQLLALLLSQLLALLLDCKVAREGEG
jgi:hypothetical protein